MSFAITPHFDLAVTFGEHHLVTDGGWRLFLVAFVRAKRPVDVVKADNPRFKRALVAGPQPQSFDCRVNYEIC